MLNDVNRFSDETTTTTDSSAPTVDSGIATLDSADSERTIASAPAGEAPPAEATKAKEKRGWFHSLTRRKKSQSHHALSSVASSSVDCPLAPQNNNNGPSLIGNDVTAAISTGGAIRKPRDERSMFARFRKKMSLRFYSLRRRRRDGEDDDEDALNAGSGGCTDASGEFVTNSPLRRHEPQPLSFSFGRRNGPEEETDLVPFTNDYQRFIVRKWLEREDASGPNRVMYKACSEMLGQVWYWGEISRRDAQKQLTDKPTGSFLVRDSETSGCQFTLSFRIVNMTLHYRLEHRDDYWHFEELQYESIVEMIEDILYRCTNDNFVCFVKVPNEMQPPFPVILKYPLSRYLKMPPLQDLCRRVIQKHATLEEILRLQIPPKLHEYLREKREVVF